MSFKDNPTKEEIVAFLTKKMKEMDYDETQRFLSLQNKKGQEKFHQAVIKQLKDKPI